MKGEGGSGLEIALKSGTFVCASAASLPHLTTAKQQNVNDGQTSNGQDWSKIFFCCIRCRHGQRRWPQFTKSRVLMRMRPVQRV